MATLKEVAQAYEPPQITKNITELEKVSVDIDVFEKTFKEGTDEEYKALVTTIDDEDYRVPKSVLEQLKVHLLEKPGLEFVKVIKSGTGINTNYTVIPLE